MIIVTDLLIINHFISVSVTLAYLTLEFKHLTPYHILSKICISTTKYFLSSESHLYKLSMFVLVYIIILNLYK